jgi:hypothetical protein
MISPDKQLEGNMSSKPKHVTAFVVHQRLWWYNDEYHMPGDPGTPIKTFLSREKAEAYRREQECAGRKNGEHTNPFTLQGLTWEDWSSVSQDEFDRRMRQLGVDPIGRMYPYEWWEEIEGDLTEDQRNAI